MDRIRQSEVAASESSLPMAILSKQTMASEAAKYPTMTLFASGPENLRRAVVRCQATSRRTKRQCAAAAVRGKRVCKWHGGLSTGPKTLQGRLRCAKAKTVHGTETRALRADRKAFHRRLATLVEVGRLCGAFQPVTGAPRR